MNRAGERLNRMNHCVYSGRGGYVRWQANGELGIQQCNVGQQLRRDDRGLGRGPCRDDGYGRHLGTGPGGSGNLNQRQPFTGEVADSVRVDKRLRRIAQRSDQLCHVHRTSPAQADYSVDLPGARAGKRIQHDVFRRVCLNVLKNRTRQARAGQAAQRRLMQSRRNNSGIRHQEHFAGGQSGANLAEPANCARLTDYRACCVKRQRSDVW